MTGFYNKDLDVGNQLKFVMWNLITNSILKHLDINAEKKHEIIFRVVPNEGLSFLSDFIKRLVFIWIFVLVTICFAVFLILPIKERVSKVKLLQFMSGVRPIIFWIVNLLWDLCLFILTFSLITLVLFAFDEMMFFTPGVVLPYILLVICFSIASLLSCYLISFIPILSHVLS